MSEGSFAKRKLLHDKKSKLFFIIRIVGFVLLAALFLAHPEWYAQNTSNDGISKKELLLYFALPLVCIILPLFKLRMGKIKKYILFIPVIALSLLLIFAMGEHVMKFTILDMKTRIIKINILLIFGIFLFFFVFVNRIKISLVLSYILVVGFSTINYFVYLFRGEPINAADLYVTGTALNVAADYNFDIDINMFRAFFALMCFICIMMWLPEEKAFIKRKKFRLLFGIPILAFVVSIFMFFAISEYPRKWSIKVKVFEPYKSYHTNGVTLNFVRGFYYMKIDKPENYSSKNALEMMERSGYISDDADMDDGNENPNVIIVMNECLTDFTEYSVIECSEDPLEYIHSLKGKDNAIIGTLHTDVFGGRTANSEYEFLTGNSVAFMPASAVPYALYVRKEQPSIVWDFRDAGYSGTDAFHPYKGNGYSRPRAYPNLGFRKFIAIEDIQQSLTDGDYLRNRISDLANFKWVQHFYEQEKKESDSPFFIFNVTMQNHGGFKTDYDNLIQDIEITGKLSQDDSFKRFINLVDYTDEAFEELTDYFSKVEEPTIIVMFGDHRPNLHNGFYKNLYGVKPKKLDKVSKFEHYKTPLIIWANYDINKDAIHDEEFEEISINYLSAAINEMAGIPQTAYQKFLNQIRREIPVFTAHGYMDNDGNVYDVHDEDSPFYELVKEYNTYEYNYQFDSGNRNDEFFMLKSDFNTMNQAEQITAN